MQVQVVEDDENTFKPIKIQITIETKEEWKALHVMTVMNASIPNLISHTEQKGIVEGFLNQLRKAIHSGII